MKSVLMCITMLIVSIASENNLDCPADSTGHFPNCICENNAIFDSIYNWCPKQLIDLKGGKKTES